MSQTLMFNSYWQSYKMKWRSVCFSGWRIRKKYFLIKNKEQPKERYLLTWVSTIEVSTCDTVLLFNTKWKFQGSNKNNRSRKISTRSVIHTYTVYSFKINIYSMWKFNTSLVKLVKLVCFMLKFYMKFQTYVVHVNYYRYRFKCTRLFPRFI